ncbi:hypothetical protein [Neochlamydia sp. S13]|uniref:hypothetical protein n=1 Tax=Neochlamydia sp. S13 TaxID=1353976 RepID=UPI0005A91E51|nr:hypothetical protein [Neochlamydia sp. S13]BBI17413.1 hypothetical protein NCS13_1_1218 [Neochlamydia sp. S13]
MECGNNSFLGVSRKPDGESDKNSGSSLAFIATSIKSTAPIGTAKKEAKEKEDEKVKALKRQFLEGSVSSQDTILSLEGVEAKGTRSKPVEFIPRGKHFCFYIAPRSSDLLQGKFSIYQSSLQQAINNRIAINFKEKIAQKWLKELVGTKILKLHLYPLSKVSDEKDSSLKLKETIQQSEVYGEDILAYKQNAEQIGAEKQILEQRDKEILTLKNELNTHPTMVYKEHAMIEKFNKRFLTTFEELAKLSSNLIEANADGKIKVIQGIKQIMSILKKDLSSLNLMEGSLPPQQKVLAPLAPQDEALQVIKEITNDNARKIIDKFPLEEGVTNNPQKLEVEKRTDLDIKELIKQKLSSMATQLNLLERSTKSNSENPTLYKEVISYQLSILKDIGLLTDKKSYLASLPQRQSTKEDVSEIKRLHSSLKQLESQQTASRLLINKLKQQQRVIVKNFIDKLSQNADKQFAIEKYISELTVAHPQARIINMLLEYKKHSSQRFAVLIKSHREFTQLANYALSKLEKSNLSEEQVIDIKAKFKSFLILHIGLHTSDPSDKKNSSLYRAMQGSHSSEKAKEDCKRAHQEMSQLLHYIFDKQVIQQHFAYPEETHVVPYPALFSWNLATFTNIFFNRENISTRSENREAANAQDIIQKLSNKKLSEDVGGFSRLIQEDSLNLDVIQQEIDKRYQALEQNPVCFILDALLFLSRIASLQVSETEDFPYFFNQTMDKYSETLIKPSNEFSEKFPQDYKKLLGKGLVELLEDASDLSAPSTTLNSTYHKYFQGTRAAIEERLISLAKKGDHLTLIELMECHALISILTGVEEILNINKGHQEHGSSAMQSSLETILRNLESKHQTGKLELN